MWEFSRPRQRAGLADVGPQFLLPTRRFLVTLFVAGVALGSVPGLEASDLSRVLSGPAETARRAAPSLGVHVLDVASGETVYAFHPDELRIIASAWTAPPWIR